MARRDIPDPRPVVDGTDRCPDCSNPAGRPHELSCPAVSVGQVEKFLAWQTSQRRAKRTRWRRLVDALAARR